MPVLPEKMQGPPASQTSLQRGFVRDVTAKNCQDNCRSAPDGQDPFHLAQRALGFDVCRELPMPVPGGILISSRSTDTIFGGKSIPGVAQGGPALSATGHARRKEHHVLEQAFKMNGIEKLSTVRGFLLDMDGTFYLSDRLLEGALRFIDLLREQKKGFLFLTNNSSKQGRQYAEKISRLGLPLGEESVLTSGEATALYLRKQHPGARLFLVGTPSLEDEFRQHGFRLVQQEPQFLVLGFDTTLTYQKLWALCDFVRAGVPYIATHPDFNCPTEKGFMPDVGAMIAFVRAATGREPDLVVGKPNRLIVDAAAVKLNLPVNQLAMIGDRLYTDIALGEASGIATVLVLSGETKIEDLKDSPFRPDYTFQNLAGVADWLERNC